MSKGGKTNPRLLSRRVRPKRRVTTGVAAASAYSLPRSMVRQIIPDPPPGVVVKAVATTPAGERKLRQLALAIKRGRRRRHAPDRHGTTHWELVEPMIAPAAYAPSARARALLRGTEIAEADLKEAGGTFDLQEVQTLLSGVSRQAIEKRVKEGSLLAVPGPSHRRLYPTIQFTREGLVPGLKEVKKALPTQSPWAVLNFFVRPDARLEGRRPIDVLREGHIDLVVSAARSIGMQGW